MDLQIDEFYKDCAAGLLLLYQVFPQRTALYVEDLIGLEETDEFGLPSKRHLSCLGAMLWLADEGWIRPCLAKKALCAYPVRFPTPLISRPRCRQPSPACSARWPGNCVKRLVVATASGSRG